MRMKRILVAIVGVSPLIMNAFSDAAAESASEGSRASAAAVDRGSAAEQCEARLYIGEDGQIIMPQPNLFSCIVAAGTFYKSGRSKLTTQRGSLLPGCMFFDELYYALKSKDGWSVDTRPVRIPATGGRILRHRPIFHDWSIDFELMIDSDELALGLAREVVDAAGRKIGLGDFRPQTKGPFGRFRVDLWQVTDEI